jgi:ABC-type Na+ efflux pump permease subunit
MDKILILFKREYRAAVRTKSFIISLVLVPLLMGGGFLAMFFVERNEDTDDKRVAVIDYTGYMEEPIRNAAEIRNAQEIYDPETSEKVRSAYLIEFVAPDPSNRLDQELLLSQRVQSGELHAFVEIGPDVLHPSGGEGGYIRYYS